MTKKGGKMRKSIVGLLLFIGVAVWSSQMVHATPNEGWGNETAFVTSRIELDELPERYPCEGAFGYIQVQSMGEVNDACIQGSNTQVRFAQFIYGGVYKYAVAFPTDTQFYEVRGLCSHPRCVYAAASDILIDHTFQIPWRYGALAYKNFSKSLIRMNDGITGASYFQFHPIADPSYMVKIGDYIPSVEAISVSQNGKWALFELKSYGIVRVNLETLDTKRIIAPGADYGLGRDPLYELAITNDGMQVALGGRGVGLSVIEVDDSCGDRLVPGMEVTFPIGTRGCIPTSINSGELFPGLSYATMLKFDEAGRQLQFIARYGNGRIEKITLSPFAQSPRSDIAYLALGDSFTSGEGESADSFYQSGTNEPFFKCHVSTRSYPYLIGLGWNKTTRSTACSGAQTVDILGGSSYNGQGNSLSRINEAKKSEFIQTAQDTIRPGIVAQSTFASLYNPQLITVGIGGNDAGLIGKLTSCLNIDTCEWAQDPLKRYATSQEIAAIYPKVREVLKELRNGSPVAQIAVVGYPQIIDASSDARCDQVVSTLLNSTERTFIHETIQYLNEVIHAAAYAENLGFIDIEDSLKGHELCGEQDSTAMNAIRIGDDIAPFQDLSFLTLFGAESFHPTSMGHALISQAILKKFPSTNMISLCAGGCLPSGAIPQVSAYWTKEVTDPSKVRKQKEENSISEAILRFGKEFLVTSPLHYFAPGSMVSIEIHSHPVSLGAQQVGDDGALRFTGSFSRAISPGYHVLHLLGTSWSDEPIDIYRSVFVEDEESKSATASSSALDHSQNSTSQAYLVTPLKSGEVLGDSTSYLPGVQKTHLFDQHLNPKVHHPLYLWIGLGLSVLIVIIVVGAVYYCFSHPGG